MFSVQRSLKYHEQGFCYSNILQGSCIPALVLLFHTPGRNVESCNGTQSVMLTSTFWWVVQRHGSIQCQTCIRLLLALQDVPAVRSESLLCPVIAMYFSDLHSASAPIATARVQRVLLVLHIKHCAPVCSLDTGNDSSIQMFSSGSAAAGETHSSVNLKHSASASKQKQHQGADSEDAEEDSQEGSDDDEQTGSEEASEGQQHVGSSSRGGEDGTSGSSGQDRQSRPESGASASCRSLADPSCPVLDSKDVNEEANVIRKAFKIKVTGGEPPCPLRSFAEMGVRFKAAKKLLANITAGGYGEPTPIQRQAIPALLGGRELLAVAPTGEGQCGLVAGSVP